MAWCVLNISPIGKRRLGKCAPLAQVNSVLRWWSSVGFGSTSGRPATLGALRAYARSFPFLRLGQLSGSRMQGAQNAASAWHRVVSFGDYASLRCRFVAVEDCPFAPARCTAAAVSKSRRAKAVAPSWAVTGTRVEEVSVDWSSDGVSPVVGACVRKTERRLGEMPQLETVHEGIG